MKVCAPFHVGTTFDHGWELFSFRAMVEWFDDVRWDYYFSQRLASQGDRLMLCRDLERWQKSRKKAKVPA
jgi:hypothetical protein